MAQKWERIQETKDLFPNLEFRTVGDDRVRDAHQELHGIIKPIDDPFWSKYYPPLDWRCRCDVVQTAADPTGEVPDDMPEPNFIGNVAIDAEIFTQKHNFFKLLNKEANAKRNLELMKLNAANEVVYKAKNGKKVYRNIFYDKSDYPQNLESAKKIVNNLNVDVYIRPHLDTNIAIGRKNPEYFINGYVSDLKWNFKKNNYKGIVNAISAAKKQGTNSVVFDYTKHFDNLKINEINKYVTEKVHFGRAEWLKEIIFIYKNKVVIIERNEIIKGKLPETLKRLKADS